MNSYLLYALCFLGSFLVGSIPTAYLVTKRVKNTDIREHGSGNVGATNAARVLGKKWGIAIFILDFLKGAIPAFAVGFAIGHDDPAKIGIAAWCSGGAILGHIFTPFLGFKGGKGVATGGGVLFGLYPFLFLMTFPVWLVTYKISKIVSISSLAALFTLVIYGFLLKASLAVELFFIATFVLISWTHRDNLARLTKGEEKKM